MGDAKVSLEEVTKAFRVDGRTMTAVDRVSLGLPSGEIVCLLGPSGCGKSTLLGLIAGFAKPTRGRILVDGRPVVGPGVDRGVVFQQFVLFPWLTALENVEFGPKLQGQPRPRRAAAAMRYMEMVGLAQHASKFPTQLSGGMKQRVAIARALVNDPGVLLMDEPFGALDAQTRELMQEELLRIQAMEHKTILFVTHSIQEALFLGDTVVVMTASPGRLKASLPVHLAHPRDKFSPAFVERERKIFEILREEILKTGVR